MTSSTPTIELLLDLPRSERRDALEELVVAEFKATLLMSAEDELPLDQSYFDLGLTSLTVADLKQRLEQLLGREINANILFNSPTAQRLLEHLTEDVLHEVFARPQAAAAAVADHPAGNRTDGAGSDLYQR